MIGLGRPTCRPSNPPIRRHTTHSFNIQHTHTHTHTCAQAEADAGRAAGGQVRRELRGHLRHGGPRQQVRAVGACMGAWAAGPPTPGRRIRQLDSPFNREPVYHLHSLTHSLVAQYPLVFGRVLDPVFDAANVEFEVRNHAMGNNPAIPAAFCVGAQLGEDTDVAVWEFGMMVRRSLVIGSWDCIQRTRPFTHPTPPHLTPPHPDRRPPDAPRHRALAAQRPRPPAPPRAHVPRPRRGRAQAKRGREAADGGPRGRAERLGRGRLRRGGGQPADALRGVRPAHPGHV